MNKKHNWNKIFKKVYENAKVGIPMLHTLREFGINDNMMFKNAITKEQEDKLVSLVTISRNYKINSEYIDKLSKIEKATGFSYTTIVHKGIDLVYNKLKKLKQ